MKHLLIIGARGFGREVYSIACESIGFGETFDIKGFLDDKVDALKGKDGYPPILGSVEDYNVEKDDVFICALGDVNYKKKYASIILQKNGEFISLIHNTVTIGKNSTFGKGCIFSRYASISCDIKIGDFVTISTKAGLGHDVIIGNWCHVGGLTNISGFVRIGDSVTIHPGSNITPHRNIGSNSTIGVGSVVVSNVKEGTTVFGNPARRMMF